MLCWRGQESAQTLLDAGRECARATRSNSDHALGEGPGEVEEESYAHTQKGMNALTNALRHRLVEKLKPGRGQDKDRRDENVKRQEKAFNEGHLVEKMQHRLERGLRVVTRDGGRDKCSYLYDHERLVPKVELNPVVIGSATSVVNDDAVLQENLGLPSAARSGWTRAARYPGLGEPAMEGSGCGRHFLAAHQFRPLSRVVSGKERGTRWERLEKRGARKGGERHRGQGDRAAAECACSRDGGGVNEILHVVALHRVQLYSRQ